jgi:hypothetical protein
MQMMCEYRHESIDDLFCSKGVNMDVNPGRIFYSNDRNSGGNLNHIVPPALANAIIQTRMIADRPHQKCNRTERVNHFVTCLRRELHELNNVTAFKQIKEDLCNKSIWYDIGEIEMGGFWPQSFTRPLLSAWLQQARVLSISDSYQYNALESSLQQLRGDLEQIQSIPPRMQRINDESEEAISRFVTLLND